MAETQAVAHIQDANTRSLPISKVEKCNNRKKKKNVPKSTLINFLSF